MAAVPQIYEDFWRAHEVDKSKRVVSNGPGFTVLYRWRLHPGMEAAFVEAWTEVSVALRQQGSLGSRLHRGSDGLWYSYAQWPSAEARSLAFARPSANPAASVVMQQAIAERLPEIVLESVSDLLVLGGSE